MTRDEILNLLQYRLGDHSEMPARGLAEMPLLQSTVLEANSWLPWFLEVDSVGLETVALIREVVLPTGFLQEMEEGGCLSLTVGTEVRLLTKKDYKAALSLYGTAEKGAPWVYSLGPESISLFPIPDQVYALDWKYYGAAPSMAASAGETLWTKHAGDLVLALLGEKLAGKHLQNLQLAGSFKEDAAAAWQRLYHAHLVRASINQARALGGND